MNDDLYDRYVTDLKLKCYAKRSRHGCTSIRSYRFLGGAIFTFALRR